jgi:hypothetical protein
MRDPLVVGYFFGVLGLAVLAFVALFAFGFVNAWKRKRRLARQRASGRFQDWDVIAKRLVEGPSTFVFFAGLPKSCELWWTKADVAARYEHESGCRLDGFPDLDGGFVDWIRKLTDDSQAANKFFRTLPPPAGGRTAEDFRSYVESLSGGQARVIDAWGIGYFSEATLLRDAGALPENRPRPGTSPALKRTRAQGTSTIAADGWSISIESSRDDFPCIYLEGSERQLGFTTWYGPKQGALPCECNWKWKGELGERESIPPEHRRVIIERIAQALELEFGPDARVNREQLQIEAGLAKPKQVPPDEVPTVLQIDESHLRFSYKGKSVTVPFDFKRAPPGAAAIQYTDLRRWDEPHQDVMLTVQESGFVMHSLASFMQQHHGRSLIMYK